MESAPGHARQQKLSSLLEPGESDDEESLRDIEYVHIAHTKLGIKSRKWSGN